MQITFIRLLVAAAFVLLAGTATNSYAERRNGGIKARILNGQDAASDDYSFMAALVYADATTESGQFCGGTVIDSRFILTAAHCVTDPFFGSLVAPETFEVALGSSDLRSRLIRRVKVEGIILHPFWNPENLENDFALVKIAEPANVTPVAPAATSDFALTAPGAPGTILGWGQAHPTLPVLPALLQQATVPVAADSQCLARNGRLFRPASMVCAGDPAAVPGISGARTDACFGDSGGPLLARDASGAFKQIGVTSWGFECGSASTYGVYARVSAARPWILGARIVPPFERAAPEIAGDPIIGSTLSITEGRYSGDPIDSFSYQWTRTDGGGAATAIPGATSGTYTVSDADAGSSIGVTVTARNSGGASVSYPYPIGPITEPFTDQNFASGGDSSAPALTILAKRCDKSGCSVFVQASDPSGVKSVTAKLSLSVRTERRGARKARALRLATTAAATQLEGSLWMFRVRVPKGSSVRLGVIASDSSGNTTAEPLRFSFRRKNRS